MGDGVDSGQRVKEVGMIKKDAVRKESVKKDVVRKVEFNVAAEEASQVFVAGSFNDWQAEKHPMKPSPKAGVFKTTVALSPGRYEYKFVVDGNWMADPACKDWVTNACGSINSVINV
jgi:1,4-alpha-glucan branching enzyme